MINLPASVKVGYIDYEIRLWSALEAQSSHRLGEADHLTQVIRVSQALAPRAFAEVLLHELLHALFYVYNIQDEDREERTVGTLSTAIAAMWRDNPELVAYLGRAFVTGGNP